MAGYILNRWFEKGKGGEGEIGCVFDDFLFMDYASCPRESAAFHQHYIQHLRWRVPNEHTWKLVLCSSGSTKFNLYPQGQSSLVRAIKTSRPRHFSRAVLNQVSYFTF